MARTLFTSSDQGTPKRWSIAAMAETARKSYFVSRMMGTEDQLLPVVNRNELESGPGDEVTFYLVAKITGRPIQGDERQQGRAKRMTDYTDRIKIDRQRQPINIGDLMAQKRRPYDLKMQALARLSDYWAEYLDEEIFAQLSGRRGTGANIQHLELGYAGFPNALVAPDSNHLVFPGSVTTAAGLAGTDIMTREFIELIALQAKTMIGGDPTKPVKMSPCDVEGAKYFVAVLHEACMFDLRQETGEAGWLAMEKARATAVGSQSPIFKGSEGAPVLINNVIVHSHNTITYQDDYGAGSNIRGFRNLFLGAHAVGIAFGTQDRSRNGVRLKMGEADEDYGDDTVLKSQIVAGVKKTVYNSQDFAVIAMDCSASSKAQGKMRS